MDRSDLIDLLGIKSLEGLHNFCTWLDASHPADYIAIRGEPRYTVETAQAILKDWRAHKAGA